MDVPIVAQCPSGAGSKVRLHALGEMRFIEEEEEEEEEEGEEETKKKRRKVVNTRMADP